MPLSDAFRAYLESLPDELLESVTEDYIWLSGQDFDGQSANFTARRECCRVECLRRGLPHLYRFAETVIAPCAA